MKAGGVPCSTPGVTCCGGDKGVLGTRRGTGWYMGFTNLGVFTGGLSPVLRVALGPCACGEVRGGVGVGDGMCESQW